MTMEDRMGALVDHYTDDDGVFHAIRAANEFLGVFHAFGGYSHPHSVDRRVELAYATGVAVGANGVFDETSLHQIALHLLLGVSAFEDVSDA